MTALREHGRPGPLSALLARAQAWLLAPPAAELLRPAEPPSSAPSPPPPVVAVVGLAPRAGASTIARALAGRLARLEPADAAILLTESCGRGPALSAAAAHRLAVVLTEGGCSEVRACRRVCLVPSSEPLAPIAAGGHAPIVVDVGHGGSAEPALAFADHVALIVPPDVEPALAATVEASLRGADRGVSLVVNRALEDPPADLRAPLVIPESRLAARAALGCRDPRGALAEPIAELADRCLAEMRR